MKNNESSNEFNENTEQEKKKDATNLEQEISAGEWKRLGEFETYRRRSRQGKIITTHQAISNRIRQLEKLFYEMCRYSPDKATKLLTEIKRLRFFQELLLHCLIWEERGEFERHPIPDELSDIL